MFYNFVFDHCKIKFIYIKLYEKYNQIRCLNFGYI